MPGWCWQEGGTRRPGRASSGGTVLPGDSQTSPGGSGSWPSFPFWVLLYSDAGSGSLQLFSVLGLACAWDLHMQLSEVSLNCSL